MQLNSDGRDEFTGFEVQLCLPLAIEHYWTNLEDMLQRVPHTWEEYTLESLHDLAMNQHIQVWSVGTKTQVKMFIFTQIAVFPAMKILKIMWGAGTGVLDEAEEVVDATLERFAQLNGCARMDLLGRRGWRKKACREASRRLAVVLSRPVPPERGVTEMTTSAAAAPSQTTTTNLTPQQKEIQKLAMPGIREFAATVPERYQGSQVAGFDPLQTQGQEQVLSAAQGQQQQLANAATNANTFALTDIWNPSTNPNLQNAIDAAVRPITEQYQGVVRPAIRDDFQGAGQQFGGSRRNVAEGVAGRGYLRQVGDTASKLVQDQYANNLSAYIKALGLVPQTQQAALAPGLTTSGVGDVRQALSQLMLNQDVSNFNYDQLAPFLQSKELWALLNTAPGGSTTTTATAPAVNKPVAALGGAAAGASLGGTLGGPPGAVGGAAIGGLLPFIT